MIWKNWFLGASRFLLIPVFIPFILGLIWSFAGSSLSHLLAICWISYAILVVVIGITSVLSLANSVKRKSGYLRLLTVLATVIVFNIHITRHFVIVRAPEYIHLAVQLVFFRAGKNDNAQCSPMSFVYWSDTTIGFGGVIPTSTFLVSDPDYGGGVKFDDVESRWNFCLDASQQANHRWKMEIFEISDELGFGYYVVQAVAR